MREKRMDKPLRASGIAAVSPGRSTAKRVQLGMQASLFAILIACCVSNVLAAEPPNRRACTLDEVVALALANHIPNWAVGTVVSWSFLDIPTIRARSRAASAQHAAAAAQRDEVYLEVQGQLARASAVLNGAIRVAQQTPLELAAARTAEQQAVARYKTGLAPVVDVADAQRVLVQAEIDDAVARLDVQRARLLLARASGDLGPFLAPLRKAGG